MKWPEMPEAMGVLRCVQKPTYDQCVEEQCSEAVSKSGDGDLEALFNSGDTWEVK
jgi:2-oxoglutarate ferredoxin oxidoreductase subunit beta